MPPSPPPHRTHPGAALDDFPQARQSQEEDALAVLRKRYSPSADVDGTHPDDLYAVRDLPLPVGKTLCLRVKKGKQQGREFFFTRGNITIGRSEDADVTLNDSKISRKHVLIEAFSREEIFLTDMAKDIPPHRDL